MHAPAVRGDADGAQAELLRNIGRPDLPTLGRVAARLRAQIGGTLPVREGYEPLSAGKPVWEHRSFVPFNQWLAATRVRPGVGAALEIMRGRK